MLREQLTHAMKESMKSNDKEKLGTVRMILAAIKQKDIDARPKGLVDGIPEDQIVQLMQTMIKQRRESIAMFTQANRMDLVEKEESEISIIFSFLPKQLDDTELKEAVTKAIHQADAKSPKDMGAVMTILREEYAGQMDFGKASTFLKDKLSSL
ncbi:MAG: GatB/YqeY domain-containing protein [Alphaproteobacteria bacterium]